MTKPRIVITQRVHPEVVALLEADAEVVANCGVEPWANEELIQNAQDADALMVFMPDSIDAEFLARCPRLKIIAGALKGFDNFDVEACRRRGIWFTIVADLLAEPTAELALALLLALSRNVRAGDECVRGGGFRGWRPVLYGRGLAGSTVGLIGYGSVGRAFERLISGFDCRLIWHDAQRGGFELDELLAASDFVLPLVPLTHQTFHLLDGRRLGSMKRGAHLINVGRGSVVDEDAVADALEAGHLAGYAADVFEMEDWVREGRPHFVNPRLMEMTGRTLFTPHLGSATRAARLAIERTAANSILRALRGERPDGAV